LKIKFVTADLSHINVRNARTPKRIRSPVSLPRLIACGQRAAILDCQQRFFPVGGDPGDYRVRGFPKIPAATPNELKNIFFPPAKTRKESKLPRFILTPNLECE